MALAKFLADADLTKILAAFTKHSTVQCSTHIYSVHVQITGTVYLNEHLL
jgi:hypothetical protein